MISAPNPPRAEDVVGSIEYLMSPTTALCSKMRREASLTSRSNSLGSCVKTCMTLTGVSMVCLSVSDGRSDLCDRLGREHRVQHLVDRLDQHDLQLQLHVFGELLQIAAVRPRQHDPAEAGAMRCQHLLLHAAHRKDQALER